METPAPVGPILMGLEPAPPVASVTAKISPSIGAAGVLIVTCVEPVLTARKVELFWTGVKGLIPAVTACHSPTGGGTVRKIH